MTSIKSSECNHDENHGKKGKNKYRAMILMMLMARLQILAGLSLVPMIVEKKVGTHRTIIALIQCNTILIQFHTTPHHTTPFGRGQHQDLSCATHGGTGRRWYHVLLHYTGRSRVVRCAGLFPFLLSSLYLYRHVVIAFQGLWHVQHVDKRYSHRALADGQAPVQLQVTGRYTTQNIPTSR